MADIVFLTFPLQGELLTHPESYAGVGWWHFPGVQAASFEYPKEINDHFLTIDVSRYRRDKGIKGP